MDHTLLSQARSSYLKHFRAWSRARYRGSHDSEAIEGILESIGTYVLAGGGDGLTRGKSEHDAALRLAVRRQVNGWGFLHLGDAALFAMCYEPGTDEREPHLAVRDQVELIIVGARALLGVNCLTDEALSSVEAFDELIAETLTKEERDGGLAWMVEEKRAKSWRAPPAKRCQVLPFRLAAEQSSVDQEPK